MTAVARSRRPSPRLVAVAMAAAVLATLIGTAVVPGNGTDSVASLLAALGLILISFRVTAGGTLAPQRSLSSPVSVAAATLAGAVDLDSIRADLARTVHATLQPAHLSVWVPGERP